MTLAIEIPRLYGLIILVAVQNWFILMWQALRLAKARKEHDVKYPTMYENKEPSPFNCVQRAHQNSLEWNPGFLSFLFISGITTPIFSTAAGVVYNVGRVYYAKGYYRGNPHEGLWGLYGLFYLVGGACYTAFTILRS
ncbi:microsomal glutathione S-transferase [Chondrus crispus]|uniref:Glutathione S-transferase 3, mitochondrial n=1 Tax=Chondrus crispus TaxID=2769 RepID=R7QEF2_CHOCR|nr:microsomal glutathione S-transferase [Chondrus crispus]CDF36143.1 microsomal glutathione S-transferase [Chondrus crispus]|eukprot:XP_005715962.1 microsomal glutathione S-transferase [Chondrus crispus]